MKNLITFRYIVLESTTNYNLKFYNAFIAVNLQLSERIYNISVHGAEKASNSNKICLS